MRRAAGAAFTLLLRGIGRPLDPKWESAQVVKDLEQKRKSETETVRPQALSLRHFPVKSLIQFGSDRRVRRLFLVMVHFAGTAEWQMARRRLSYLVRRGGIFWLRMTVPRALRSRLGRTEWKFSLRTGEPVTAKIRCLEVARAIARVQLIAREMTNLTDEPGPT